MATLIVVDVVIGGVDLPVGVTPTAVGGTDTFTNDGNVLAKVVTAGTAATVTFVTPGTLYGLAIADATVVLPATGTKMIGPFQPGLYNDTSGNCSVSFGGTAGVTIGLIRKP